MSNIPNIDAYLASGNLEVTDTFNAYSLTINPCYANLLDESVDTDDIPYALGTTYEAVVSAQGPLHYYRLGETTGTSAADIGSNPQAGTYTVTITGANNFSSSLPAEVGTDYSKYMNFSPLGNLILPPGIADDFLLNAENNNPWSVTFWIRFPSSVYGILGADRLFDVYYSNPYGGTAAFNLNGKYKHITNTVILTQGGVGDLTADSVQCGDMQLDTWYHVAMVNNNTGNSTTSTGTIFVNAVVGQQIAIPTTIFSRGAIGGSRIFWWGADTTDHLAPAMYIDEIALFNRALLPSEVTLQHSTGAALSATTTGGQTVTVGSQAATSTVLNVMSTTNILNQNGGIGIELYIGTNPAQEVETSNVLNSTQTTLLTGLTTGTGTFMGLTAPLSGTDLASTNSTNAAPVVTSATHNFVAADVGQAIDITVGTNWIQGIYTIISCAANAATLDRPCGTVASITSGTWNEGALVRINYIPPLQYGSCNPYTLPTFNAAVDITGYVAEDFSVTYSRNNVTSSATLNGVDQYASEYLANLLQPNTMVRWQRRVINKTEGLDTGFVTYATLYVNGPIGEAVDATTGEKRLPILLSGVTKLLSFDIVNYPVTPDLIHVPRTAMVQTYSDGNITIYQVLRAGSTSAYYYNWATAPTPRMWALKFSHVGNDVVSVGDTIPITTSNGNIQTVGGAGEVIFNTNYLTSAFYDSSLKAGFGLGNPQEIDIDFYRYATYEDITVAPFVSAAVVKVGTLISQATFTVNNATVNGITPLMAGQTYAGRTIFIKSGNSLGRSFKIVTEPVTAGGSNMKFNVKTIDNQLYDITTMSMTAGDLIQITDANMIQDALLKVLTRAGFQFQNSSDPFYAVITPPPIPVQVPPFDYVYNNNIREMDLFNEIIQYGPPNYFPREEADGSLTIASRVQLV
ncbi:MAG TPA: hypothetical protein VKR58_05995 [Aquella sp.]|nr:hypothetical protein [Aquella sp.]